VELLAQPVLPQCPSQPPQLATPPPCAQLLATSPIASKLPQQQLVLFATLDTISALLLHASSAQLLTIAQLALHLPPAPLAALDMVSRPLQQLIFASHALLAVLATVLLTLLWLTAQLAPLAAPPVLLHALPALLDSILRVAVLALLAQLDAPLALAPPSAPVAPVPTLYMPTPLANLVPSATVGSLESIQPLPPLDHAFNAHQPISQSAIPAAQLAVLTVTLALPTPHAQPEDVPPDSTFHPTVHASMPPLPKTLVSSSQEWLYYP